MTHNLPVDHFTPNFNSWPLGSLERFIHGCWQLRILRFHAFSDEFSDAVREKYNSINHTIGVQSVYIDLLSLTENNSSTSKLFKIIRNHGQPTWIWFTNSEALLDTSRAGWLRSILTTYCVDHVRVTFLLDSQNHYNDIFLNYSAPFYKSTTALELTTL
ncbi:hypothetical protein WOB70_18430 [Vibrio parahaemolyticus]|uniref:hypothetical protein n=1 Tax=Vibrio parahaemolyticus TaxID=670 RepID=UPI000B78A872|nr:hypothetical protein [Vibrio parahaemolyticus]EJG1189533.1 hypothetical protein [Vibrio parahaemolyticus]EKY4890509.1 hypothetical protein [Vibrio parahaemolyticus]OXD02321.1 hypothetical protein CA161_11840 [Vibrio parahaemolyticus]